MIRHLGKYSYESVNSTCAQPLPRATAWHLPALSVPGDGAFANFALPGGRAFANPRAIPAASFQNKTTQKVLPKKKKQIGSSVKDRNKLKRVVKACSLFHACISSLLIKSELHHEIGAIAEVNLRFLVIEEHPFIFIKLFITYNFTALY